MENFSHYYSVRRFDTMKKIRIFALILAFLVVFSGCGASNEMAMDSMSESINKGDFFIDAPMEEPEAMPEEEIAVEDSLFDSMTSENVNTGGGNSAEIKPAGRKLIRTFNLDIETLEFDSFVASIKAEVNSLGGYIESSSTSGNSYNYSSSRYANFVCRVPSGKLDEFINTVGGLGNITYCYEDTEDVTLHYVDTEARIKSLQTEYDQLLELLAEAENIDTIILLQQRLTEVRYQLESYESQLRTYDNLVDYSTVNLSINEVKRITAPEQETVFERIRSDFSDNIYDIWVGAQDFFVWFVANIPYFLIWGVIIAAIIFVIRFILGKSAKYQERKAARKARKEYKKAQKLAKKNASAEAEETLEEK